MGQKGNADRVLMAKYERKRPLGKPNRDGIIKFKTIFKELFGSVRIGLIWLRTVTERRLL